MDYNNYLRYLNVNEYYQNEIENIENQIAELQTTRKPYIVQTRLNPMRDYSDDQFRCRFRLTKESVVYLNSLIREHLEPKTTRNQFTLSAIDKILITLRYYATGCFRIVTADFYGVSETTICRIVPMVSYRIAALRQKFIGMPSTREELEKKKQEFFFGRWHARNCRCTGRHTCKNPRSGRRTEQNGFFLS